MNLHSVQVDKKKTAIFGSWFMRLFGSLEQKMAEVEVPMVCTAVVQNSSCLCELFD